LFLFLVGLLCCKDGLLTSLQQQSWDIVPHRNPKKTRLLRIYIILPSF
jgi:hypothetical protein